MTDSEQRKRRADLDFGIQEIEGERPPITMVVSPRLYRFYQWWYNGNSERSWKSMDAVFEAYEKETDG